MTPDQDLTFFDGNYVDMNFEYEETIVCGYYSNIIDESYNPIIIFYDLYMNFKSMTYYNK
jgi:hypothetical protein